MTRGTVRILSQAVSALAANLHLAGWLDGTLYRGPAKAFCIPGLHCYSCPSAVLACPVGSVQNLLATPGGLAGLSSPAFGLWTLAGVAGFVMLPGFLAGRIACSHMCPFGLFQDILHLVRLPPLDLPDSLRRAKYAVLAVFVLLLPLLLRTEPGGGGDPWFCKAVCPAGTVWAGWPLVLFDAGRTLRTGFLFAWKSAVAAAVVALSTSVSRPFCRYLCPLGAAWGLAGRGSVFSMRVSDACTGCGTCRRVCPMGIEIRFDPSSAECIRCGRCIGACPAGALSHSARRGRPQAVRARRSDLAWIGLVAVLLVPVALHVADHGEMTAATGGSPAFEGGRALDSLLAAGAGRPVILNFWATWCTPCIRELPEIEAALAGGSVPVTVIGVDIGDPEPEPFRRYASQAGLSFPLVWVDPETAALLEERYRLPGLLPSTMVLDGGGAEVARISGARDRAFFEELVSGLGESGSPPGEDEALQAGGAVHINLVGTPGDPAYEALSAEALTLAGAGGVTAFDPSVPADSQAMAALSLPFLGHPYAQACVGAACGRPSSDPGTLRQTVEAL